MSGPFMKKSPKARRTSDMRAEYDFRGAVRGKYAARYRKGTNLILLDPDLAATFPDAAAVNHALRTLLEAVPPVRRTRRARSA